MQANDQYLLEFLEQTHQLNIPIYQRKYSWTSKQCKQLFEDIERIGDSDEKTHFLGAIVFKSKYEKISKKTIIDGQQRITTLNLLIGALANYLYNSPDEELEIDYDELVDSYLLNPAKKGDLRYKLILTEEDKNTLIKIVDNVRSDNKIDFTEEDSSTVYKNYEFFKKRINEENLEKIYNGLSKLLIVYMELTDYDNPQLIFESMNSTGLSLNKTDLIRNFLLMKLDETDQETLYENYWREIERTFEKNNESFDKFIKSYLVLKYDKEVSSDIYEQFKKYSYGKKIEDIVMDIYKYFQYFTKIVFGREENKELNNAFINFNKLSYDVVRPFLLRLYDDYDSGDLSAEDFIKIMEYTESYTFRRFICDLDSKSLRKTYAEMYGEIDKDNYVDSYKFILTNKKTHKRMPKDNEFIDNLATHDMYNIKNRKFLLGRLENFESKEMTVVDESEIEIEHIMPQTLNDEWKRELGDWEKVHKEYLHTIGNLTLSGYNKELSNKSFYHKKNDEDGYSNSKFTLNKYFDDVEHWNEYEITKRRDFLIEKALEIWQYPDVSQETIDKYLIEETSPVENKLTHIMYWNRLKSKLDENPLFTKVFNVSNVSYYNLPLNDIKFPLAHMVFRKDTIRDEIKCEVYIGYEQELFNYLYDHKDEIEVETDLIFNWKPLESQKSSKIEIIDHVDIDDINTWDEAIDWHYDVAEKMYSVFSRWISSFNELPDDEFEQISN